MISRIGLGCVTFGREIDQRASFAMMDHAVERGIVFFDTAAAYGAGASETIVGQWLAANRVASSSITVASKITAPFTPETIRHSVTQSLQRLGTDTIALLYLHNWHCSVYEVEVLKALNDLIINGKVQQLGASNFSTEQLVTTLRLQEANGFEPFRFIQNNNNLAVSDLDGGLRRVCKENEIKIVTYSPLAAGFLTGKHQQGVQPGSRFDLVPGHQDVYFQEHAYQRLAQLQLLSVRTGYSPAHLALAWALHQPRISSVLIGGRTPAQIDQAIEALNFNDETLFKELEM